MKRILQAVFFPPKLFRWIFGVVAMIATIWLFMFHLEGTPVSYVVYLCSALGLYYLITVTVFPAFAWGKAMMLRFPLGRRYMEEPDFKARVRLYFGTAVNLLFALIKLISGVRYGSTWLFAVGVYYLIVMCIRFSLIRTDLRFVGGDGTDEAKMWQRCKSVGWGMLLLNIGLSGISVQVIEQGQTFTYPGYLIFAIAFYAFYRITTAIVRMCRKREKGAVLEAARVIDLSLAIIAMFTLQVAMFHEFSSDFDTKLPNICMSTMVTIANTVLAVRLIRKSSKMSKSDHGIEKQGI